MEVADDNANIVPVTPGNENYDLAIRWLGWNNENWSKYKMVLDYFGYQKNITDDNSVLSMKLPSGDMFIPDAIKCEKTSRGWKIHFLLFGNIKRDDSPNFIDNLKAANQQFTHISLHTLWEKDIMREYKEIREGKEPQALGRICYRGKGTYYSVDYEDIALFHLSHTEQETREHYSINDDANMRLGTFMKSIGKSREIVLAGKEFPCAFQTIRRDELPADLDTVALLGKTPWGRQTHQLWRTAGKDEQQELYQRQCCWSRYHLNADIRKRFLPYMEQLGLFENRIESPYGLLYRVMEDGSVYIPDFVDLRITSQTDVVFIDDRLNGQVNAELLGKFEEDRQGFPRIVKGYAISKLDQLEKVMAHNGFTRREWSDATIRLRCGYILKHIHIAELKKTREEKLREEESEKEVLRNEKALCLAKCQRKNDELERGIAGYEKRYHLTEETLFHSDNVFFLSDGDRTVSVLAGELSRRDDIFTIKAIDEIPELFDEYERHEKYHRERIELLPFMERIGYAVNRMENQLGLVVVVHHGLMEIPDFIGEEYGHASVLFLLDNTKITEKERFESIRRCRQYFFNRRITVRAIWTGYQSTEFKRAVFSHNFNWTYFKLSYLGVGNTSWEMLNDPGFREYYWSHSAKDTAKHYHVTLSQLQGVIRSHQELRRPDDTLRVKNALKANIGRISDFEMVGNVPVSRKELSLESALKHLGILHNDAETLGHTPYCFNAFGIRSMHPDYIASDGNVVVEFDGEYFHLDPAESIFRKTYYDHIGKKCSIIWESEYDEFLSNPPTTVEELLERYPCSWRNKRAEEMYVLHHEHDNYLHRLEQKIYAANKCGNLVDN